MIYEYNEHGVLQPYRGTDKNGRFRYIEGKMVRIGDGSRGPVHYAGSDSLGEGIQGLVNPANGQKYDSRSEYYKAVKAAGCEVLGNDAPTTRATPKTESIDWKQAVGETLNQIKSNSPTKKGKKK